LFKLSAMTPPVKGLTRLQQGKSCALEAACPSMPSPLRSSLAAPERWLAFARRVLRGLECYAPDIVSGYEEC
jgi:hypothetical protein